MPLEPEAFQKTQRYQVSATVPEVLEALAPKPTPAPSPEPESRPTSGFARLGKGLLVVSALSFVGIQLLPSERSGTAEGVFAILFFACFISLLGGVISLIASAVGPGPGFSSRTSPWPGGEAWEPPHKEKRRLMLATVLQRFQVDLLADVKVTLDLTQPMDPSKLAGKGPLGKAKQVKGQQGPATREDFVDPWLSLQGRFADGTQLHLSVVDQVRVVERMKAMPLKTKVKRKRSGVSLMTVALRVKPERHPGLAARQDHARSAVKLPPGVKLKRVRVDEDRAELRVQMDEGWVAHARAVDARGPDASRTVTMMLLSLYQVLNHSSSQGQSGKMRSTP